MIRFYLMQSSKLKSVGFFSPPFTFSVVVAGAAIKHPECSSMDVHAESLQSCPILCDTMNHSSPGSCVHGILQARILEWLAMPSSRDLLDPGIEPVFPATPELQADSLLLGHLRSPLYYILNI